MSELSSLTEREKPIDRAVNAQAFAVIQFLDNVESA
jgi:hypothetical protein